MSVEPWTQTPVYTISGIGPYEIKHPYVEDAIRPSVIVGNDWVALNPTEFILNPLTSPTSGNLYLTPAAATTHAGRSLVISRVTPDQQGWLPLRGEREAGLAAQLDRMVQGLQEVRAGLEGTLRIRDPLDPFVWADGTVPVRSGDSVISGPTAIEIIGAQGFATAAAASAAAAAASAADALARALAEFRPRGNWGTGVYYTLSDVVYVSGSSYYALTPHFATVFATDLANGKWFILAQQGAAGVGTGDVLKSELLAGFSNYPQVRTNLGLGALATLNLLAFSFLDPSAIISDVSGLANNKVPNAIPVAKAVTDWVESLIIPAAPLAFATLTGPVTSIPLLNLAGWDEVEILGELTMTGSPNLQFSRDNGITWRTAGYDGRVFDGVGADNFTGSIQATRGALAGGTARFKFVLDQMASASKRTGVVGDLLVLGGNRNNEAQGVYLTPEICNAVRIIGGTYATGWVEVRGRRRVVVVDTVAPVLVGSTPADNAIGIALTVSPILVFSEAVLPGTGFITLRRKIGAVWSNEEQFDVVTEQGVNPGQVSFAGATVTLNPTLDLVAGREYAIQVGPTAVRDPSNNFFLGIANDTTVSFTAAAAVFPTILSSGPSDDAVNVAVGVSPSVTFSEAIFAGTGNIVLRQNILGVWSEVQSFDVVANAGVGNGQVSMVGSVLTINPSVDLIPGREYAIRIPNTAVKNSVNNFFPGITDDTTLSFSTVAAAAPTFVVLSLANNVITYQLSGPGTIHYSVDDVASQTGAAIDAGTGAYVASNFNPAAGTADATLSLVGVPPGARKLHLVTTSVGLTNYGVPRDFDITAVAADVVAPTIISSIPADNATGVTAGVSPTITFSEPVVFGTGNVTLRKNIAGTWSDEEVFDVVTEQGAANGQISISGAVVTLNPTATLTASREYAIRFDATAIKDAAGNFFAGIANDTTLSFTIAAAADVTAPTLASSVPADNATGIAAGVSPALTFSEAIAFGTGNIILRENNGGWSDLELFDVATEQGVGNGQVSISGAVLTINPTAALTAGREYAIRIAATAIDDLAGNSYAGIANDTTVSFTVAAAGYTRNVVDNNGTGRLTSSADNAHRQSITFAGWFRTDTVGSQAVLASWAGRSEVRRFTDKLNIYIEDSTATTVWDVQIPSVFAVGTWVHIYVQVDLNAVTAVVKINGTTISGGGMTINTALTGGSGLIYLNTGQVELLHTGAGFIFDGSVSDLVDYHTTGAGKPSNDFYNGGTGTDPTAIGTPFVVLGGTMTADARAGNTAQGWNDSYTPGSATITTNSATFTDSTI